MRSKNAELKTAIYRFVNDWKRDYGQSPSLRTIGDKLGVSRTTVQRYLTAMSADEASGLTYDGKKIDTREMNTGNMQLSPALIVGNIPCGEAVEETAYVEGYINLPAALFGKGDFYILHAKGDSMEDAGIFDGDLVVIRKQITANKGDIVVALDGDNQNTLKRFGGYKGNYAVLEYMNETVYPGKVIKVRELTVQGVAKFVIRSL